MSVPIQTSCRRHLGNLLSLIAVAFLLIATFTVQATALAIGNRVQANANLNVRSTPAGTLLGTQPSGALGTITAGPITATLSGTSYVWWQVNWDINPDGWSVQDGINAVPTTFSLGVNVSGQGTVTSSPSGINCGSFGSCSANFSSGTNVTLSATPAAGWFFVGWTGACSGDGSCVVPMTEDHSVLATFNQNVSLLVDVTGSGTVSSSPSGINNCSNSCSANFSIGQNVTLSATPAAGWTFAGWTGACAGTGSCVVSMTVAKSVTATFNPPPTTFSLGVNVSGQGTVTSSPSGINCGSFGSCSANFSSGTNVTLSATPAAGWFFVGWTGACSGDGSCVVPMTEDHSVLATFNQNVSLSVDVTGSGTVSSSPSGINNCSNSCSANFSIGQNVTLSATPAAGWTFAGWTGACAGTGSCVVSMTVAKSVTATFNPSATLSFTSLSPNSFTTSTAGFQAVTTAAGSNFNNVTKVVFDWSGATSGSNTWNKNDANWNAKVTVNSDTSMTLRPVVTAAGDPAGTTTWTVTLTDSSSTTASQSFTVTYTPGINFSLTVAGAGTGGGKITGGPATSPGDFNCTVTGSSETGTCSKNYSAGTAIALTATADSASSFGTWTGCDSATGTDCVLTMPSANKTVTASFNASSGLPPPTAMDQKAETSPGETVLINLAFGATGGKPTSAAIVSGPTHGVLKFVSKFKVNYTLTTCSLEPDSFTFTLSNAHGTSNEAKATITINPVSAPTTEVHLVDPFLLGKVISNFDQSNIDLTPVYRVGKWLPI